MEVNENTEGKVKRAQKTFTPLRVTGGGVLGVDLVVIRSSETTYFVQKNSTNAAGEE